MHVCVCVSFESLFFSQRSMQSSGAWQRCRKACGRRPPRRVPGRFPWKEGPISDVRRRPCRMVPRTASDCVQPRSWGRPDSPATLFLSESLLPLCQAWPVQMLCREADPSGKAPTSGKRRPELSNTAGTARARFWASADCGLRLLHFIRHGQGFHNSLNDFCKVYQARRPINFGPGRARAAPCSVPRGARAPGERR